MILNCPECRYSPTVAGGAELTLGSVADLVPPGGHPVQITRRSPSRGCSDANPAAGECRSVFTWNPSTVNQGYHIMQCTKLFKLLGLILAFNHLKTSSISICGIADQADHQNRKRQVPFGDRIIRWPGIKIQHTHRFCLRC